MNKWKEVVVCYPPPPEGRMASNAESFLAEMWLSASAKGKGDIAKADSDICDFLKRNPHWRDPIYVDPDGISGPMFYVDMEMLRAFYKTELRDEVLYVIIGKYKKLF